MRGPSAEWVWDAQLGAARGQGCARTAGSYHVAMGVTFLSRRDMAGGRAGGVVEYYSRGVRGVGRDSRGADWFQTPAEKTESVKLMASLMTSTICGEAT